MCYHKNTTFNQNKTTMENDQWFEPGEKVTRVARAHPGPFQYPFGMHPETDFGKVLSVSDCKHLHGSNRVWFTGIKANTQWGWPARNFRRISEVQLCVKAAQHFKKPVEEEVKA